MDIKLIAKLKPMKEFLQNYDLSSKRKNEKDSILFYSVSNSDLVARYDITNFLLDEGFNPVTLNGDGETLLHVLLSQVSHDLEKTTQLCCRLIDAGVDVNVRDAKQRLAFQYVVNLKYTDKELEPLYDKWLKGCEGDFEQKNAWGVSPLEIAKKMPYRKGLVERLEKLKIDSGTV